MKGKMKKILTALLVFALFVSLCTVLSVGTSAAVTELRDNKEAHVIEATETGSTLTLNWNTGYITVPGKNGQLPFYLNDNTSCFYTDVLLVKKAGTEITFSDGGVFLTNGGYVISSWTKSSDGYWVGDPDSANYYGMDKYTSPVQTPSASGGMNYKYVTSKDNETIRLGFRAGNGETECPKVTFKLTGEKGTFTKELEEENTAASFNSDGSVSGIYWTCGYIGSSTNTNGYPGSINPSSANFAYSSIVKVAKAGTVITFTDASGTAYAANNAYVISLWKKDSTQNRYYIDNTKTHYAGNNGADNVIKKGDTVVFTEKKNSDGSVTYTYVTQSDNENLRFCYHTGSNFDTVPSTAAKVTWQNDSSDVGADVFDAYTSFVAKTFPSASNQIVLPYRLYVPEDYDATKSYPLIVFLHGAGERGSDNAAQLKNGILVPFNDKNSPIHDCIVVAPQCPSGSKWVDVSAWTNCEYSTKSIAESKPLKAVVELIDVLKSEYSIDSDRVYATGLSMGGYGTWDLLARHSEIFAAAIPVCGGVDVSLASIFKDIPIYTFHGLKDTTVPSTGTVNVVNAIKNLGGNKITLVTYPDGAHSIWNTAYGTSGLIEWLLTNKLSDRMSNNETEETLLSAADTTSITPTDTTSSAPADTTEENTSEAETTQYSDTSAKQNNSNGCGGISYAFALIAIGIVSNLGFAIIKKH